MEDKLYQDDFCNHVYQSKYGNTLTTLRHNGLKGNKKKYILCCDVCSIDEELFPEGSITCSKSSLLKGIIPCGCSKRYKWSMRQREVLIKRRCTEVGYTFIGIERKHKGASTKVKLYNKVTKSSWSVTINNFLNNKRGDPVQGELDRRINGSLSLRKDHERVTVFESTEKFLEGSTFSRSNTKNSRGESCIWEVTCPICSKDKYVKAGLCSGVFLSTTALLTNGCAPCRCSVGKFTKEQREFLLTELLTEEGGTFIGWVSEYINSNTTKFKWLCSKGHYNTTTPTNFLGGNRCATCGDSNGKGYYRSKESDKDYLYILKVYEGDLQKYFKVGRSFNPKKRIKQLKSQTSLDFEVTALFTGTHREVYGLEQKLIGKNTNSLFDNKRPSGVAWSSELIDSKYLQEVCEYVEDSILLKCK